MVAPPGPMILPMADCHPISLASLVKPAAMPAPKPAEGADCHLVRCTMEPLGMEQLPLSGAGPQANQPHESLDPSPREPDGLYAIWLVRYMACTLYGLYATWLVRYMPCTLHGLYATCLVRFGLYAICRASRMACTLYVPM
jgi:hypothetical protein